MNKITVNSNNYDLVKIIDTIDWLKLKTGTKMYYLKICNSGGKLIELVINYKETETNKAILACITYLTCLNPELL